MNDPRTADAAVVSRMMWERAVAGSLAPAIEADQLLETCEELTSATQAWPMVLDHCQFDAVATADNQQQLHDFGEALFAMDMDGNAEHARLLQLEGIQKQWVGPRQEGYDIVRAAMGVQRTGTTSRRRIFPTKRRAPFRLFRRGAVVVAVIRL